MRPFTTQIILTFNCFLRGPQKFPKSCKSILSNAFAEYLIVHLQGAHSIIWSFLFYNFHSQAFSFQNSLIYFFISKLRLFFFHRLKIPNLHLYMILLKKKISGAFIAEGAFFWHCPNKYQRNVELILFGS